MSEWKPIESAPRDKKVLLYFPPQRSLGEFVDIGYAGRTPHRQPTHWIAIPDPPKGV